MMNRRTRTRRTLSAAIRWQLVQAIGSWRVRREGWDGAELAHPFWDRIVGWIDR